jgi:hypothetical protein
MAALDIFLKQHKELATQVQTLRASLKSGESLSSRADVVRSELSRLVGTLSVHLAMEDKYLYPRLAQDERADVAMCAKRLAHEMLPVASAVKEHSDLWQIRAIREDSAGFALSTNLLLDRITERMAREEGELYPFLA